MLPKLRKSLQKNEKRVSPPTLTQKSPLAIEAPKAVIRALYDYVQRSSQELSFNKGDFFHVVGNENDHDWYEACNPATGARGIVPAQYFQILGKNLKESNDVRRSVTQGSGSFPTATIRNQDSAPAAKATPLYGIVQYDFQAERPDELDAKAGEAIIIIAQSNHEWFVAKPIGRLGGPGLIPVSFIEIRDMSTGRPIANLEELAAKAAVPKVEEWKKAAAEYKSSSIPLGRFDFDHQENQSQAQSELTAYQNGTMNGNGHVSQQQQQRSTDPLYVVKASVDQYLRDEARYWFLVRVEMNDGRHRNLCRYYEDFYEFQIALLEEFPVEAGRTGEERILPYMPGPLTYVDDTISAQRRADLSIYVEELCQLPAHVVRHPLIQDLFSAREGDVESSHPTSMMPQPIFKPRPDPRVSGISHGSSHNSDHSRAQRASHYSQYDARSGSSLGRNNANGTNTSGSSGVPNAVAAAAASSFIKIKVFYEEDLIAIRVTSDIDFDQLCEKLKDRLTGPWSVISVKDESRNVYQQIANNNDFQNLLDRSDKVVLYVQ